MCYIIYIPFGTKQVDQRDNTLCASLAWCSALTSSHTAAWLRLDEQVKPVSQLLFKNTVNMVLCRKQQGNA